MIRKTLFYIFQVVISFLFFILGITFIQINLGHGVIINGILRAIGLFLIRAGFGVAEFRPVETIDLEFYFERKND